MGNLIPQFTIKALYEGERGISFLNKGKMTLPLEFVYKDGNTKCVRLPVEIWMKGSEFKYRVNSTKRIETVEMYPRHQLSDVDISKIN